MRVCVLTAGRLGRVTSLLSSLVSWLRCVDPSVFPAELPEHQSSGVTSFTTERTKLTCARFSVNERVFPHVHVDVCEGQQTSLVGAPLGAGGAGAGGAATARPLQGRLHGNVSPPQVRIAMATQKQHRLSDEETPPQLLSAL